MKVANPLPYMHLANLESKCHKDEELRDMKAHSECERNEKNVKGRGQSRGRRR